MMSAVPLKLTAGDFKRLIHIAAIASLDLQRLHALCSLVDPVAFSGCLAYTAGEGLIHAAPVDFHLRPAAYRV